MRLKPEQLAAHLARGLAPVYVVSGDEPLQRLETLDSVRAAARAAGFTDRIVLEADADFEWAEFSRHTATLSLFGDKRLLELRLSSPGRLGAAGAEALTRYAGAPPADTVLLIAAPRLDQKATASGWYRALERAGVCLQVWPVAGRELVRWVERRMRASGLEPTPQAAAALAERVEGNLLAAAQEIAKLGLVHGRGSVDVDVVHEVVAESARYSSFDLLDSALAGEAPRSMRILRGLREEGVDPLSVLGPLAWALRALAEVAVEMEAGGSLERALAQRPVWRRRQHAVARALRRHPPSAWWRMLQVAARVDRAVKGGEGEPWEELQRLVLVLGGVMPAAPSSYNAATT